MWGGKILREFTKIKNKKALMRGGQAFHADGIAKHRKNDRVVLNIL